MKKILIIRFSSFGDIVQCSNALKPLKERYPNAEDTGVYKLRKLEYQRHLGEPVTDADYAPFINGEHGEAAAQQAQALAWFYEKPNRALVGMNVNGKGRLLLDGKTLMAGDNPFYLFVVGAELGPGVHRIAGQVEFQRGEPWLQVGVRMHDGVAGTGPGSLSSRNVSSGWATSDPVGTEWYTINLRDVPRGVPDAPYLGGVANAFILLQSKSYPIRGLDWGYHRSTMYFRENFTVPISGWPDHSTIMTGLEK